MKEKKEIDYSTYSDEELSLMSEKDHHEDVKHYDVQQNSLAFVVLGGITLVCGLLFLILSFRRVMNKVKGIDTRSLQFFVCIACFVIAVALLSIGLTRLIIATIKRTKLKKEINSISIVRKELASKEKIGGLQ